MLLLVDNTVFGSAKENVLVTAHAIYRRSIGRPPARIQWTEIDPATLRLDGSRLVVGAYELEGPPGFAASFERALHELGPLARRAFGR